MIKRTCFLFSIVLFLCILVGNGAYGSFVSFRFLRHKEVRSKRILIYGSSQGTENCLSAVDFCDGIEGLGEATKPVRCLLEIMPMDRRHSFIEALQTFTRDRTLGAVDKPLLYDEKHEKKIKKKSISWLHYVPCDERTQFFSDLVNSFFQALHDFYDQRTFYKELRIGNLLDSLLLQANKIFPGLTVNAYKRHLEGSYATLMAWKESLDKIIPGVCLEKYLKKFKDSSHFITTTILGSAQENDHLYRTLIDYIMKKTNGDELAIKELIVNQTAGMKCCFEEHIDSLFASIGFLFYFAKDQWNENNHFTVGMFNESIAYGVCSLLQELGYECDEERSMITSPLSFHYAYYQGQNKVRCKKGLTKLFQIAFSMAHPATEEDFLPLFQALRAKVLTERFAKCSNHFCTKVETSSCPFKACSRCRNEFYCSRACQKKHWYCGHKKRCVLHKPAK